MENSDTDKKAFIDAFLRHWTGTGYANHSVNTVKRIQRMISKFSYMTTNDRKISLEELRIKRRQVYEKYHGSGKYAKETYYKRLVQLDQEIDLIRKYFFENVKENPRPRKYVDVYIVQGNYGSGWEDLVAETTWREAKERLHEYNENERGYSHRRITRKVKIEDFEKGKF